MGATKFGQSSGFPGIKQAQEQAKGSPAGRLFFGGLGGATATPKNNDSQQFAGEEQQKPSFGQPGFQGKGKGLRMAGLFGGIGGLFGRGRTKKRFGLF
tara:strand:+ start:182 stop:475 length:294 start_codon:yes stop_codon:yes gene_type:complete